MFLFAISAYIYLPPVEITDFVVDTRENIIVLSTFQDRIFYISKAGRVIQSRKFAKGTALSLAIDRADNIYILKKKNTVEILYSDRLQKPKTYTAPENFTNEWVVDKNGNAVNLSKEISFEAGNVNRTRKPVFLGGALFFQAKNQSSRFDPFKALGKTFKTNPYFADRIMTYDSKNKLIKTTSVVPILLKPFSFIWDYTIITIILILLLISLLFNRLS